MTEFALAQGFVQATGMLAGLIYVRVMPVEEYAVYALCLTALSVAAVGSDLGLTGSLGYFWRKYSGRPEMLAPIITLIRRIRTFLFAAAFMSGAIMVLSATRSSAISVAVLALCLAIVAATAWVQMRISIDILLVRLGGHQRRSYLIEARGNTIRLGVAILMIATGIGTAWFGLLGGLLGALAVLAGLRREPSAATATSALPDARRVDELRGYVLPLLPSVLVYMIQEPLVLWLAAVRGSATTVAEVHALGRIAAIFSLMGTFSYILMTPHLARTKDGRTYAKTTVVYATLLCVAIVAGLLVAWAFPQIILTLIGGTYAHLTRELLLSLGSAGVSMLTWFITLANRGRGWIALDRYFALAQAGAIGLLCLSWQMETTARVLQLSLALNTIALAFALATVIVATLRPSCVLVASKSGHHGE